MERHPARMAVVSSAALAAGIPLRTVDELRHGNGISADITGAGWHSLGVPGLPVITPHEAGMRCAGLLHRHEFVVFEYSKTDHAGHAMGMEEAVTSLEAIDGFVGGILDSIDMRRDLFLLTSDHGNVEDLSTKTHTRNPVPAIFAGHRHAEAAELFERRRLRGPSILDVTPVLLSLITSQ
jgi:2,3-bisphosphoglycerate-independent phosphoglycerate mutase